MNEGGASCHVFLLCVSLPQGGVTRGRHLLLCGQVCCCLGRNCSACNPGAVCAAAIGVAMVVVGGLMGGKACMVYPCSSVAVAAATDAAAALAVKVVYGAAPVCWYLPRMTQLPNVYNLLLL